MNPLLWLGGGLGAALNLWTFIKSIPSVWKLVVNYKDVQKTLTDVWGIYESAKKNGGVPHKDSIVPVLDDIATIFEKELIDLPNLDEVKFGEELREFTHTFIAQIETKNRGNIA